MAEAVARRSSFRPDSIVNEVTIIVAPNPAQTEPTVVPQVTIAVESQTNYGVQSIVITDSPLLTNADALILTEYLVRPDPNYWFTGLSINMHRLTDAQRNSVATLDIGDFVGVIKSFKYGTPSVVQKNLYVEGIDHRITSTTHHIDLHFSPVGYSQQWAGVTPTLTWESVPAGLSWTNLIWTIL